MTNDRPDAPPSESRSLSYDPAFRPAIEEGFLTPRQALQRGRRNQCASALASKHGLTVELALDVADNRLTLGQAIRRQRTPEADPVARRERGRGIRIALLALGVPLVLFTGAAAWHVSRPLPTALVSGLPQVLTDATGRVTRIAAVDPESVLDAYCDANRALEPCEPLGLMRAARGASRLRVGVFADPAARERLLAIPIRLDSKTGHWSAGDGASPLTAMLAPHNAAASIERSGSGDDTVSTP